MAEQRKKYAYGELNHVELPAIRKHSSSNFLKTLESLTIESQSADSLIGTGPYKAIVLRVEPKISDGKGAAGSWLFDIFGSEETCENLTRIKARIPEMHTMLPEPENFGNSTGLDQMIIEMHPTFTARDVDLQPPHLGDIVWVDFGNRSNMSDPVYLGPVFRSSKGNVAPLDSKIGSKAYSNSSALISSRKIEGNAVLSSETDNIGTEIIIDGQKYDVGVNVRFLEKRKAELIKLGYSTRNQEKPHSIVLHWDASYSANRCIDILAGRGLSTHFIVDNDGTIVQLLDPVPITAWHANQMNGESVGIDISNRAELVGEKWYAKNGFKARDIIEATVQGTKYRLLGYYPEQIVSTINLTNVLCEVIGIEKKFSPSKGLIDDPESFKGIVSHYNTKLGKWDVAGFPFEKLFS